MSARCKCIMAGARCHRAHCRTVDDQIARQRTESLTTVCPLGGGNPRRLESVHQWTTLPAPLLWWGRRDSNPHALRHMILSHARLPVPTLPPQIPATLLIIPSLLPQCIRAPEGSVRLIAMAGTPTSQIPSPPFFLSTSRHPHTLTSSPHKLTSFSHPPRRPREPPPSLPHQPRRPRTHPVIPA